MSTEADSKSAEEIVNWNLVFPNQANPNGNMFGGEVMAIMDTTAAMAAKRYCGHEVSTVTVEAVHFARPLWVGDNIKTTAKVVDVGRTSMVIKAEMFKDTGDGGLELCVQAYLKFVAFNKQRQPAEVPRLELAPSEQKANAIAKAIQQAATHRQALLSEINTD